MESYRNLSGMVCRLTLLSVGFLPGSQPEQRNQVKDNLNDRMTNRWTLFKDEDPIVDQLADQLCNRLITEKQLDGQQIGRMVKVNTLQHRCVREIGSEWLGHNAWGQLELSDFLSKLGWSEEEIALAATKIIARADYPAFELRTSRWIRENSTV